MHPILFHLAGHAISSNGVIYFFATIVAWAWSVRTFQRHDWDPQDVLPGVVVVVIAAYIGARLHGALLVEGHFPTDPIAALLHPDGLSFFGGMATGTIAALGYLRWRGLPVGATADALAPIAPVLYAIFRLGCFLNGDDYGPPTTLPWGISFPHGSPPTTVPVHPTPLYEIALMTAVFGWVWLRRRAKLLPGVLTCELCIAMGAERFVAEFWRLGDPVAARLTTSQWLALTLLATGIAGRCSIARRSRS